MPSRKPDQSVPRPVGLTGTARQARQTDPPAQTGTVLKSGRRSVPVDRTFATARSIEFDAVADDVDKNFTATLAADLGRHRAWD